MLFNTILSFVVATFVLSAKADTIRAFSGTACGGTAGTAVKCDGSCHQFSGKHSLKISGSSKHCVTYYENTSCRFVTAEGGSDVFGPGVCHKVSTGGPVGSFKCSSSTLCLA